MNKFKLIEIMGIGKALEAMEPALIAAEDEGNDYCQGALMEAKRQLEIALGYAESCARGED